MFKDTAAALVEIPQSPANTQVRISSAEKAPPVLIGAPPVPRVSTSRQGVKATKGRGAETALTALTWIRSGVLVGGGVQNEDVGQFEI